LLATDLFVMNLITKMSCAELSSWLRDTATLQEAHPFHKSNRPDWVPGAPEFRENADLLDKAVKEAENKDREKMKARDQQHNDTLLSVNLNANYIVMRWYHEKDDSLLHNTGYTLKDRTKKGQGQASVSSTPLLFQVKAGPEVGSVIVKIQRDLAAGSYQLQICKGDPAGEQSWGDGGIYKKCRAVVRNLERATWYYFRARSHGNNETSPWSDPIGIIVI